jgi:hypothetical protein
LTIKLNYPIDISLQNNEKIIKVYLIKDISFNKYNEPIKPRHRGQLIVSDRKPDTIYSKINIVYLSNYGRLIKSNDLLLSNEVQTLVTSFPGGGGSKGDEKYIKMNTNIIYNNLLSTLENSLITVNDRTYTQSIGITINEINSSINTILPKLSYRMPRIFLDVIDAFHTQNTELMQECCKRYLCITRKLTFEEAFDKIELETKLKDKKLIIDEKHKHIEEQNLTINLYIKSIEEQNSIIQKQTEELNKKDKEIEERGIIIKNLQEELEKIKLENAKLKTALSVLTS